VDRDVAIAKRVFSRFVLGFTIAVLIAGCTTQPKPPPGGETVTGGPFPVVTRYLYDADAPSAVMTLANSNGVIRSGTISGVIRGWPFAHADPGGDFGEGLFSYRINFVVTKTAANGANSPLQARGVRTVYFHPDRAAASIGPSGAPSGGEAIITDTVDMSLSFGPTASTVRLKAIMRQTSARTFFWKDQMIEPPQTDEQTAQADGYYSGQFGGYLFKSAL
jgi:hypothetical protein